MVYHDLLLALSGCPGDLFVQSDDGFKVAAIPFLHPSEVSLLNRLCATGYQYYRLDEYATACNSTAKGQYVRAVGCGLTAILDTYRDLILALERQVMDNPKLPLTQLVCSLTDYELLFPCLMSLVRQITKQEVSGCRLLDCIFKASRNGAPFLRTTLLRLREYLHFAMYKQIAAWVLHGLLVDPDGEFFIRQTDTSGDAAGSGLWNAYTVALDLLPSYIPLRVANEILYIGKAVLVFQSCHPVDGRPALLKSDQDQFLFKLQCLSDQDQFELAAFERGIHEIHTIAVQRLWMVLKDETDLLDAFKQMRDYYLVGKGDLFETFISECGPQLWLPPKHKTGPQDTQAALVRAAALLHCEDDAKFKAFSITIKEPGFEAGEDPFPATAPLSDVLGLASALQWPLQLIFTEDVVAKYNTLFRFLFRAKHIQLELHGTWEAQMRIRNPSSRQRAKLSRVWLLRTCMAFVVDNFQYYLQVDVLGVQFHELQERLAGTDDFEVIRNAHEQYLMALLAQTFRLMPAVRKALDALYGVCHEFCGLLKRSLDMQRLNERELAAVETKFKKQTAFLLKMLGSVKNRHLTQLLLRLDYNQYFSNTAGRSFLGSGAAR